MLYCSFRILLENEGFFSFPAGFLCWKPKVVLYFGKKRSAPCHVYRYVNMAAFSILPVLVKTAVNPNETEIVVVLEWPLNCTGFWSMTLFK